MIKGCEYRWNDVPMIRDELEKAFNTQKVIGFKGRFHVVVFGRIKCRNIRIAINGLNYEQRKQHQSVL